jgi:hypothetical protein
MSERELPCNSKSKWWTTVGVGGSKQQKLECVVARQHLRLDCQQKQLAHADNQVILHTSPPNQAPCAGRCSQDVAC